MPVSAGKLAVAGGGFILVMSGIRGWSVTGTLRDVVSGHAPGGVANPIRGTSGGENVPGSGNTLLTGSAIANEAEAIGPGHAYRYGGSPGTSGNSPWDCSSFVNFVIGAKLRKSIPGYRNGSYTGAVHGPPTGAWLIWPGVKTIKRGSVQAGDIMVWQTHMGIAISSTLMVSAQDEALGTNISQIEGPTGELLFPKRYVA